MELPAVIPSFGEVKTLRDASIKPASRLCPSWATLAGAYPAGTFETIVVRPTIKTSGLFGEGGEAELFFSDDEHHTLIRMTSKVPIMGSLSLHLRRYDPPATGGGALPPGRRP